MHKKHPTYDKKKQDKTTTTITTTITITTTVVKNRTTDKPTMWFLFKNKDKNIYEVIKNFWNPTLK